MRLTRPFHLLVQRRDRPEFSLEDLLHGGAGLRREPEWLALAPHLDEPLTLSLEELAVLDAVGTEPVERDALAAGFSAAHVDRLVEAGLLIGDHDAHAGLRERERLLRSLPWWTPAIVAHRFGRWSGLDVAAEEARQGKRSLAQLISAHGAPPAATIELRDKKDWLALPATTPNGFDELLDARATCRNFDPRAELALADLSRLLRRVFGAQAEHHLAADATVLKKSSPSGGGLHPVEAFLLVQRVSGLAPGLYHYQPLAHALEPLVAPVGIELAAAAHELVAGQTWFALAPVQILLAARFDRSFWKYRNHAKAWRVLHLDAGHLSQTLYLSDTEQGLGAFITAAINDDCAERLFGLDGLRQGALAVCGFGARIPGRHDDELASVAKSGR
jgi:putative peptide maturation dehydrogenase